jgi:hypothetical protein
MKSIFTKIHYPVFIISFAIGMFLVYLTKPVPKVIIKYPTPESVENLVYQDDSENCYQYTAEKVECEGDVKTYPVQSLSRY